jgi:hypothetical protein
VAQKFRIERARLDPSAAAIAALGINFAVGGAPQDINSGQVIRSLADTGRRDSALHGGRDAWRYVKRAVEQYLTLVLALLWFARQPDNAIN